MKRFSGFFGLASTSDRNNDHSNSQAVKSNLRVFDFEEIKTATKNFSSWVVREDKYGKAYYGKLSETEEFEIKVFNLDVIQGSKEEWLADLMFLGQMRHHSLLRLVGYCCTDEHRAIVYEHTDIENMGYYLFENGSTFGWTARLVAARGAAKSLAFLLGTDKSKIAMIIDSITTYNIVSVPNGFESEESEDEYNPHKLVLFKPLLDGHGPVRCETRQVPNTEGHDVEKDVLYRYGVVLLELLTRLPSTGNHKRSNSGENLIVWHGRELKNPQDIIDVMDKNLEGEYSKASARIAATLATKCLGNGLSERYTFGEVIKVLEQLLELNSIFLGQKYSDTYDEHHGEERSLALTLDDDMTPIDKSNLMTKFNKLLPPRTV